MNLGKSTSISPLSNYPDNISIREHRLEHGKSKRLPMQNKKVDKFFFIKNCIFGFFLRVEKGSTVYSSHKTSIQI